MIKYCEICKTKVAELAPGTKIKKGTVFLCKSCELKRIADKFKKYPSTLFNDTFGNIFK